ncbi:MAG: hypothetical protein KA515_00215 [Candidatus Pacebacteria bacterium]|nr:hypothetical protein [Candidatus Paceibacterota bacterium]
MKAADLPSDPGTCKLNTKERPITTISEKKTTRGECVSTSDIDAIFIPDNGTGAVLIPDTSKNGEGTLLKNNLKGCSSIFYGDFDGCLEKLFYFLFYAIPSFLITYAAYFFNAMVVVGINSTVINQSTFIQPAWAIVRDLSNLFFILILLYVAIKTILGMGGHDTKKMISSVIIMALLINFSMFFTKIIIDSSNILALIFYNKLEVNEKRPDGSIKPRSYTPTTKFEERDIAGGMVKVFNPTHLLSQKFYDDLKRKGQVIPAGYGDVAVVGTLAITPSPFFLTQIAAVLRGGYVLYGSFVGYNDIPMPTMLALILITGLILGFATYAFTIAGLAFLSRLIELWILIIFSPFAFMSFVIPQFAHVEYIGWDSWLKRLLEVSFMAPIFMFFMYFIFLLISTNIFDAIKLPLVDETISQTILGIIIPATLVLILLLQATKFAKKSSGVLGEAVISGAKVLGGLAIGGAALGTAFALRGTVGKFMKGASTGDTAANRLVSNRALLAKNQAIIANPAKNIADKSRALAENNRVQGDINRGKIQQALGVQMLQNWVGKRLNTDQHNIEHAGHARHDLDEAAGKVAHGKKWDDLNGQQRYEARRQIARDRVVRDNKASGKFVIDPTTGLAATRQIVDALTGAITNTPIGAFGTRNWDSLSTDEREAIDKSAEVGNDPATGHAIAGRALANNSTVADGLIQDARGQQGLISKMVQSSVTGTYDPRNLASIIAKEQSTGVAKAAMMLTGAVALGMRGALKQAGANHGEAQGNTFKDIGNTISDALKSAKINVDLSHVGEEKKEDHKGGGGGHH